MAERLDGYTALITGGSSGMGYEMAKQLLSQGATVIVTARAGRRLNEAAERLAAFGDVHAAVMDVRSEKAVEETARWVEARFDRLDMVVSNAGIGNNAPGMASLPEGHRFYDVPPSAVRDVIDTNLTGFFLVARSFVPRMVRQGRGSLVYVSTSDATTTRPGQLPYGPSKAGGEAMAAIMAEELRGTGVTVNVICPGGFTDTAMAPEGMKERFLRNGLPVLPPDVMNRAISFLASSASEGISGEKIVCRDFEGWLKDRGVTFE